MTVLENNVLNNIDYLTCRLMENEEQITTSLKKKADNTTDIKNELKKLNTNISRLTDILGRIAARL